MDEIYLFQTLQSFNAHSIHKLLQPTPYPTKINRTPQITQLNILKLPKKITTQTHHPQNTMQYKPMTPSPTTPPPPQATNPVSDILQVGNPTLSKLASSCGSLPIIIIYSYPVGDPRPQAVDHNWPVIAAAIMSSHSLTHSVHVHTRWVCWCFVSRVFRIESGFMMVNLRYF